ncbi:MULTISPECIES: LysR substrate-binding domain-containing protein [unclassified Mesorhizobium]|uniref:LysR substrate-binding domain-containing protein n=1 Tax=unclassified Mesorhizobium TaxID=325217 RepID=UPI00095D72A4|nr:MULTISPECIES: LysR substrate-binding domain-containing protein [unclassified Mesorhizobium]MBN9253682.1 LysR family transcriptional regulator [Mesorhizobium sp.]OJX77881.1 MAG: LysR family transcriptional regulator [Mesorhizobium sp. 65-26]
MRPTLDSDLLRTFVAIVDTGNFTKAAERAGRTQSAVSMQMKKLEAAVGNTLFERGSRGVVLTRRGGELVANARRIVSLLDEAAASLAAPQLGGPVRIGIPEEYGHAILSRALSAFSKRHAKVEVTVRYAHSGAQIEAVETGELDLAVVFEWQGHSGGEVLMHDPTVWVTSTLHNMHEERPVPIALYNREGWCRDFAIKSLEERGLAYRVAYTSDTNGGLKLAVTSGLAIAPISRSNIPAGCRELSAADGFGAIDSSNVVMRRSATAGSEAIDGMADAIREAFINR